jgi:hypothetical protein
VTGMVSAAHFFGENNVTQPPYTPPPVPPGYAPQTPGQPPYGQPYAPMPQAPAKTPFYKKKWFLIIAGLILAGIIVSALGGGNEPAATPAAGGSDAAVDEAPAAEEAPEETNPGIGQPAADGDFNFVVSGVDCSLTEIGNQYLATEAQGQFCVVSVAVTNTGDSAGTFFGDNAKLFNADGQEFAADNEAAIYLEDSASLLEEINPGNTLNAKVVFDVPAGTVPTAIELHDSAFSGGVTVSLQ